MAAENKESNQRRQMVSAANGVWRKLMAAWLAVAAIGIKYQPMAKMAAAIT